MELDEKPKYGNYLKPRSAFHFICPGIATLCKIHVKLRIVLTQDNDVLQNILSLIY